MAWVNTVGYEGRRADELASWLASRGIQVLVDIRHTPWSRRPGFSRGALANVLGRHGVRYVHLRGLGAPPSLRKGLEETGDYRSFFREYRAILNQHEELLNELAHLLRSAPSCLLCREEEADKCHRSALASEILRRFPDFEGIRHLGRDKTITRTTPHSISSDRIVR